jgi:tRNA (adenine37-N6)-methyltransferase
MDIIYQPVGIARTPFKTLDGMPIQPSRAQGTPGTIELGAEYEAGLKDLSSFSHILVVSHLHLMTRGELVVMPFLDTEPRGVFATRAPRRPNPIGISVFRLDSVVGTHVHVLDVDLLDGTPVLDIKPYVPEFDARTEASMGWYANATRKDQQVLSDKRFG